jgi:hypothetical protein
MNRDYLLALARIARSIIFLLAMMVLVWALAQTLPFDVALWFAGDALLYAEVVTVAWLATRIADFRAVSALLKLKVRRRIRGLRRARALRRRARPKAPPSGEDGRPVIGGGFAFA